MDHYIRSMLDRADQVRRSEGIIYDQWDVMLMRYGCNSIYIDNIRVRIAEGLYIKSLCVRLNRLFERAFFIGVNKGCRNSRGKRQGVRKQVICTAVNRL